MQVYREARPSDVSAIARLRALEWKTENYWQLRVFRYLTREASPRDALDPRIIYVALEDASLVGFIAGQLTRRFGCDGELQWINVIKERRGSGIAAQLLRLLAAWFAKQTAFRICVDVEPNNPIARHFYTHHGAISLSEHWLVWPDIRTVLSNDAESSNQVIEPQR